MGLAEVEDKALTVPRPFNLTKPSIRKVPEPMKIDQVSQKKKKKEEEEEMDGLYHTPTLLLVYLQER